MPSRIDLYIDMVNFLLLNMIHFQRKVNWTGFLELTREFIFYILFSLKRQNYARCLSFDYIQVYLKHIWKFHTIYMTCDLLLPFLDNQSQSCIATKSLRWQENPYVKKLSNFLGKEKMQIPVNTGLKLTISSYLSENT